MSFYTIALIEPICFHTNLFLYRLGIQCITITVCR